MDQKTPMGGLKSYFSVLDCLPHYASEWLRFDVIAAHSVWALKMGWISRFLSGAVLGGFVFGFGIVFIVDQTPKFLGVPMASESYFEVLIGVLNSLTETSIPTLIVGVISIVSLLLFRPYLPNILRIIFVVVIGILVSHLMGLEKYGVSIVGPIPSGPPALVWPTLPPVSLTSIVFGALAIIFFSLLKLAKELPRRNMQVLRVHVRTENLKLRLKTGTLEEIGEDNIYRTARAAIPAAQKFAPERVRRYLGMQV